MTETIRRMQWCRMGCADHCVHSWPDHNDAEVIVAWVNANGGEARYESEPSNEAFWSREQGSWPRIAVRTIDGWKYAKPGDYVVMGDETFAVTLYEGHHEALNINKTVRDFYPSANAPEQTTNQVGRAELRAAAEAAVWNCGIRPEVLIELLDAEIRLATVEADRDRLQGEVERLEEQSDARLVALIDVRKKRDAMKRERDEYRAQLAEVQQLRDRCARLGQQYAVGAGTAYRKVAEHLDEILAASRPSSPATET